MVRCIKLSTLFLVLLMVACGRGEDKMENHLFNNGIKAFWIQDTMALPSNDSLFYLDQPSPHFRREFSTKRDISSARLFITAAGYYKASINGEKLDENILDPAWTDFSKRIYFSEYDIMPLLNEGDNCIGVILGNGFYNPLPLRKWGRRDLRKDIAVGKPVFIAKMLITYQDGTIEEIVSDTEWKFTYGPIVKNSVYLGVTYDARKQVKGWDMAGYDDHQWAFAKKGLSPGGKLQKAFFPPVQITREISPVKIYATDESTWMVDMGENFTGTYKINLSSNTLGDTITFRFGERIYEGGKLNPMTTVIGQIKRKGMGGPGAPDIAWQTDSYIVGDGSEPWFQPEFTYHTYRYMEIIGLNKEPKTEDIKGLFLHSNVAQANHFESSSELLNSIQEATQRTFLANLVSVQSDCPAREKFAYGGDLNATNESFIYNFDMQAFYKKTVYDWIDAMVDTCFVDTAPFVGIKYCGISWESAFLITQYYLYLYYNDLDFVKELYDLDIQWMEKVARIHPDGMVDKGLSDHESLEPVPTALTGTCHYLQCARIMSTFAQLMGDKANQRKYEALAEQLKEQIKDRFWSRPIEEKINKQTLYSSLLYHEVIPADEMDAANDSLLTALKNGPSSHFNTGIFGTKYMLEALSKNISPSTVYDVVNSTTYPGWGYMIDRGATTIWETWKESDNTYSNCHPMFGSVTEWFYRWLAGIRPDPENPGFRAFFLTPSTPPGLEYIDCEYHSPFGKISSSWERDSSGSYLFNFSIPEGTTAHVVLPTTNSNKVEMLISPENQNPDYIKDIQSGKFQLTGGEYVYKISSLK